MSLLKYVTGKKILYVFNFDARFKDFLFYPTVLSVRFDISLDDEWLYILSKAISFFLLANKVKTTL